ncbi:sodium:proton antiporter [Brachybacterium sp. P6-10-X1]|uniref:monovalent cation/H(+) antiporter subunit G n=1 Tax=Brachybacterium sp. P6-10-X1 TaxID=1903186 RepID=UPI0009717B8A|nr:monovalent cation/H(+) antiporter subunit G [Brachybacterium sp. P6-10-X1]APX32861.1 sodium:proton antiporter [Brachybacterium sp. P6-10-X1]
MSALDVAATVLIGIGLLLAVVAAIGLNRFDGVLMRLHAASKPQTLGLLLVFTGVSLHVGSWGLASFLVVVLLAQMTTVPVASIMVGRAAFRRGFVRGGDYAIDELSPRLATPSDDDDDEDGFIDEAGDDHEGMASDGEERFPENVVATTADAVTDHNWEEPEAGSADVDDGDIIDVDLEDETEREAEEIAERDPRP